MCYFHALLHHFSTNRPFITVARKLYFNAISRQDLFLKYIRLVPLQMSDAELCYKDSVKGFFCINPDLQLD